MGKIYKGQSALIIELDTGIDLSSATEVRIGYRKPDKTISSWTGTVTGSGSDKVQYTVADEDQLDQAGNWRFWVEADLPSGIAYGESVEYHIYRLGE